MKTVVAAIGALVLTAGVAQAAPARTIQQTSGPSAERVYHVAGAQRWQARDFAREHTPNQGSGTSRTNDANQG